MAPLVRTSARPGALIGLGLGLALVVGCGDLRPDDAAGALAGRRPADLLKKPGSKDIDKVATVKPSAAAGALQRPSATSPAPAGAQEPAAVPTEPKPRAEDGKLTGITAKHNELRAAVGVDPLVWSDEIAGFAQAWADSLATDPACQIAHRPSSEQRYGENIFWSSSQASASVTTAVGAWASEASAYNAQTGACSGVCGHYTQIVWSSTSALGCGYATCGAGEIWVCNYDPRGNILGQKAY
ncbi:MAG: hypothetical protein H6711_17980 [Myxococcales bacterium]|nr:hypothetical protein [Myxococcales bacterium]